MVKKKSMFMYVLRTHLCICIHIECGSSSSPEHHDCSEAQYYLLKEIQRQTFPRVKRKKIKLEKYFMVSKLDIL